MSVLQLRHDCLCILCRGRWQVMQSCMQVLAFCLGNTHILLYRGFIPMSAPLVCIATGLQQIHMCTCTWHSIVLIIPAPSLVATFTCTYSLQQCSCFCLNSIRNLYFLLWGKHCAPLLSLAAGSLVNCSRFVSCFMCIYNIYM